MLSEVDKLWVANQGVGKDSWQSSRLDRFVQNHSDLWVVTAMGEKEPERGIAIENWLSQRFGRESVQWIGSAQVTRFITDCPTSVTSRNKLLNGEIELVAAGVSGNDDALCVQLDWRSSIHLNENYVVFVHLVDESGNIVAQNDQQPAAGLSPTSQWATDETITDLHGLILPMPLPDGLYDVHVGMYGRELERLLVLDESDNKRDTTVRLAQLFATDGSWKLRTVPE